MKLKAQWKKFRSKNFQWIVESENILSSCIFISWQLETFLFSTPLANLSENFFQFSESRESCDALFMTTNQLQIKGSY